MLNVAWKKDNDTGLVIEIVALMILLFVLGFTAGSCEYINKEEASCSNTIYSVCYGLDIYNLYEKSNKYDDNINFNIIRDMEMYNKDTGDTLFQINGDFYVFDGSNYSVVVVRYGENDYKYYYISGYNIGKSIRYIGKSDDLGYYVNITENKFIGG